MKRLVCLIIGLMIIWSGTAFADASATAKKNDKGWIEIPMGVGTKEGTTYDKCRMKINTFLKAWKIRLTPVYGGTTFSMEQLKSNEIAIALVQGNGPIQPKYVSMDLEGFGALHKEYVHFAVKRGGKLNEFSDLKKGFTVAIGKDTGGAAMSWADMVRLWPKVKGVSLSPKSGTRARKALGNGKIDAWFAVTGVPDGSFMQAAQEKDGRKSIYEIVEMDKMVLNNWEFNGEKVYEFEKLDDDVYPGMIDGMSVKTVFMRAQIIGLTDWVDNNEALYEKIVAAIDKARPAILKMTEND